MSHTSLLPIKPCGSGKLPPLPFFSSRSDPCTIPFCPPTPALLQACWRPQCTSPSSPATQGVKKPQFRFFKDFTAHDCKEERTLSLQGPSTVSVPDGRAAHLPEDPSIRARADLQRTEGKLPLSRSVVYTAGAQAIRFL